MVKYLYEKIHKEKVFIYLVTLYTLQHTKVLFYYFSADTYPIKNGNEKLSINYGGNDNDDYSYKINNSNNNHDTNI